MQCLQGYPQFVVIPHKLIVAKRLSQCLNPALPTGVHQRTLDVYTHILTTIGVRSSFPPPPLHTARADASASASASASLTVSGGTSRSGPRASFLSSSTRLPPSRSAPFPLSSSCIALTPGATVSQSSWASTNASTFPSKRASDQRQRRSSWRCSRGWRMRQASSLRRCVTGSREAAMRAEN